ncbi:hypothetical protein [Intrasporangium mesophilum]
MAWSVPAIVLAPTAQAATCSTPGTSVTATSVNVNGGPLASMVGITVPANVRTVTYTVVGGGGGGWHSVNGQGASITGTFNGPALGGPSVLTLIAGGGGQGGDQFPGGTSTTLDGGTGYGNGGNTTIQNWQTGASAGGGGGGSAILVGNTLTGTPLVVAGGGGGTWPSNASGNVNPSTWKTGITPDGAASVSNAGPVGGAALSGRSLTGWYQPNIPGPQTNEGVTGSAGGASGASGGTPSTATVQPGTTGTGTRTGTAGGNHTTSGGNGGAGAIPFSPDPFGNFLAAGGGGGGGGYAGGAGGSLFYWTTLDSNGHPFVTAAGSGGGGSSFADPSVTATSGVTANNPNGGQGAPGSVTLTYTC